ncbi:MAG: phenylalanine--tRNA ligase subunit beta [Candidatus Dormibacteria bacterium]
MRVSREWLSRFVELDDLGPQRIAELLTLSGTEVERTYDFAAGLDQVVVAEVVDLGRLPDSDHLWLTKVRVPGAEPLEVVCGAPNLSLGAVVAWARPGTVLPQGSKLDQRRIRGTVSNGMICAPDELGLGPDHEGVLLLPASEVALGQPLSTVFPKDTILELEILSNRADCLSHLGVARELAAVLNRPLREPDLDEPPRSGPPAGDEVRVRIDATEDCPIYLAERIDQLRPGPSPLWLQRRLLAVGSHPISAAVDLANYVMLELGQPLHTFDWERLPRGSRGVQIGVRHSHPGELLACLDGVERRLLPDALVITAEDRPVALAGILGGSESAVGKATSSILLEAASFDWVAIRRTSRALGLRSEASGRFERFLSAALAPLGARRFCHLVGEVAGGRVRPGPVQGGSLPAPPAAIRVSSRSISHLLGLEVSAESAAATLGRLGFGSVRDGDFLEVQPNPVRTDVRIEVDVIEEVGRIIGYEQLPATLPAQRTPPGGEPGLVAASRLAAEICLGAGFTEAISSSLVRRDHDCGLPGIWGGGPALRIGNPLSSQLGQLRPSCLQPLLDACRTNQRRGRERTRLFEWGRVFWPAPEVGGRPLEPEVLALVDHCAAEGPPAAERLEHFLQLIQALADRVSLGQVEFRGASHRGFLPERCREVWADGEQRGLLGEVSPKSDKERELRGTTVAAELRVDGWLVDGGRPPGAVSLAKTPALVLDLAVAVANRTELGAALAAVRAAQITELEEIRMVDEYQGRQMAGGSKGWTFRLLFRDPSTTLTHRQGAQLRARVLAALSAVGAAERKEGG